MSDKPVEKAITGIELGTTGLKQSHGFIREEFLLQLKGIKGYKIYREMSENDATVGAVLFAIQMLIRQIKWRVDPFDESEAARADADFINECRNDMSTSWANVINEILSFLIFGWSYQEIVYKQRVGPDQQDASRKSKFTDNKIGWRKLPIRAQDTLFRWEIDVDSGSVLGMHQQDIYTPRGRPSVFIPIEKALLFRTNSHKGSPEGRSILRAAYRSWYFKKRIEETEAIGIERDIAGMPVAKVPSRIMSPTASPAEKAVYEAIQKIVRDIKNDEQAGLVIPSDLDEEKNPLFTIELLTTGGRRQFMTGAVIGRYARDIAMTVLADFILIGHESVGSFSLADNKTELFGMAIGAFMDEIASVFNRHAIPRLAALNSMDLTRLPTLEHEDIDTTDLGELGDFLSKLSLTGFTVTDDATQQWVRDKAGMPELTEGDIGDFESDTGRRELAAPGGTPEPADEEDADV